MGQNIQQAERYKHDAKKSLSFSLWSAFFIPLSFFVGFWVWLGAADSSSEAMDRLPFDLLIFYSLPIIFAILGIIKGISSIKARLGQQIEVSSAVGITISIIVLLISVALILLH